MKTIYWKIGLCFLVVFLAGGVIGSWVTVRLAQKRVATFSNPEAWGQRAMERLDRELKFSEAQREQVKKVIEQAQAPARDLNKKQLSERLTFLDQVQAELKVGLTDEQKLKLEKLREQRMNRLRRFLGNVEASE